MLWSFKNYGEIWELRIIDYAEIWDFLLSVVKKTYCFHLKISIVPIFLFAKVFIYALKPKKQPRHNV